MALSNHICSLDPEKLDVCTVVDDQSIASSSPCKCTMDSNGRATGGWKAASLILSMELCERLATLGIGLNLVTYLHDNMHLPIPRSANIVTNFLGTSYLTCLLGGFIADSYLGRYCTIAVGSCIQLLGIILMALSSSLTSLMPAPCEEASSVLESSACKPASSQQLTILYIALYMIAFGTGGIKSSVSGLGADQFEEGDAKGRRHMQSYFNWFGMAISIASMVAVTVLVYVQDNQGRGVGYGACAGCMAIALALFLGGAKFYHSKPPAGSALTQIVRVLVAAWRNRHLPVPLHPSHQLYHHGDAWIHESSSSSSYPHHHAPKNDHELSSSKGFCSSKPFRHTNQFLFLDKASLMPQSSSIFEVHQNPWRLSSLEHVEEVKMFFRLFPILGTTIVFWTANAQMLTFSIEQGATLNRNIGRNFEFPPASLAVFVQISMLLTIPFYDRVLVPLARKWRDNEHGITSLQRIGVGLVFSIFSMIVAALMERKRLHIAHNNISTNSASVVLPMSIFYLAPQYALVGIGEAFAYIGQLEFFFIESPHGMRSLGTGLCLSSVSCGFFLSGALVSGINTWTKHGSNPGWLANNLNIGRLDYFYLLLAFSSLLSFLAFLLCSHWFEYSHTWIMNTSHQEESICNDKAMQVGKFIDK